MRGELAFLLVHDANSGRRDTRTGRPLDRGADRPNDRFDRNTRGGERDRSYGRDREPRDREPYYPRGQRDRGFSPVTALPSPPYEGGRREDEPSKEPMSKVKFIKLKVPEDVPEKEANDRYDEYLANFWSSRTRAEFEKKKNDDDFRREYDPRVLKETIEQREKDAATKAVQVGLHQFIFFRLAAIFFDICEHSKYFDFFVSQNVPKLR